MKKIIFSSVFALIVIAALIFVVFDKKSSAPKSNTQATSTSSTETNSSNNAESSAKPENYIDYSGKALANAKGQKVLFFHAPWCPQCQSIEATILKEKGSIPDGFTILKVDYDSNQTLRQKYGVTIQTTFVKVDGSGNLIDKYVAYDEPTIDSVRKNFLEK